MDKFLARVAHIKTETGCVSADVDLDKGIVVFKGVRDCLEMAEIWLTSEVSIDALGMKHRRCIWKHHHLHFIQTEQWERHALAIREEGAFVVMQLGALLAQWEKAARYNVVAKEDAELSMLQMRMQLMQMAVAVPE